MKRFRKLRVIQLESKLWITEKYFHSPQTVKFFSFDRAFRNCLFEIITVDLSIPKCRLARRLHICLFLEICQRINCHLVLDCQYCLALFHFVLKIFMMRSSECLSFHRIPGFSTHLDHIFYRITFQCFFTILFICIDYET